MHSPRWSASWGPDRRARLRVRSAARSSRSIHAPATITFRVDHIVSGVVINLAAVGVARFLSEIFFGQPTQSSPGAPHLAPLNIPLLSSARRAGRRVPAHVADGDRRVPAGVPRHRSCCTGRGSACGCDRPARTPRRRARWACRRPAAYTAVMLSGGARRPGRRVPRVRGERSLVGGADLGLGFIALAALILSNWNPKRLMAAAMLFGFAQAVPLWLNDAPVIRLLPPAVRQHDAVRRHDRGDRGVRGQGETAGGRGPGLRGRRARSERTPVPYSRSPKSPRPGRM